MAGSTRRSVAEVQKGTRVLTQAQPFLHCAQDGIYVTFLMIYRHSLEHQGMSRPGV